MKFNLNKNLLNLDGTEILDSNMGKIVAQSLAQSSKGDALKQWDWAQKLYKGEELELDLSDSETFKTFIKSNENFPTLTKAQIMEVL
jgi:hypothetical protein